MQLGHCDFQAEWNYGGHVGLARLDHRRKPCWERWVWSRGCKAALEPAFEANADFRFAGYTIEDAAECNRVQLPGVAFRRKGCDSWR
jgi:hypothetical protein